MSHQITLEELGLIPKLRKSIPNLKNNMPVRAADVYVTIVRTVQSAGMIVLVKWKTHVLYVTSV